MKNALAAPIQIFVPFTRVNEETREVEGYAFVNEEVPSQPGVRLKRSAMEAATPDYIQWGALREMHGNNAAGTTNSVEWDTKGALIRTVVVDDQAWEKVQKKVYKGFSVGVRPKVVRNGDIEKCTWTENSLVDRPADPDAIFTLVRMDESEDDDSEPEIINDADDQDPAASELTDEKTRLERGYAMKTFGEVIDTAVKHRLRNTACDILWDNLFEISYNDVDNKEETARKCITEFADFIVPIISAGEMPKRFEKTDLSRSETEYDDLFQRAETAENQLTEVQTQLASARERVDELSRRAAPLEKLPVRYPVGLERVFAANDGNKDNVGAVLQRRLKELEESAKTEQNGDKRQEMAREMILINSQLALLP